MGALHLAALVRGVLRWGWTGITLVSSQLSFFNPVVSPSPVAGAVTVALPP